MKLLRGYTSTSHRQRIGQARTRLGLKPTLVDIREALNEQRCAEHGPDYRGHHESGDGRFIVWHATIAMPRDPDPQWPRIVTVMAPEGTVMLSDLTGGPW